MELGERMIHMTETAQRPDGTFLWYCRCRLTMFGYVDREAARKGGDEHLAKANA